MDRHLEARRKLEQPLDTARERAAVPVVEQAAGIEQERKLGIRQLRGLDHLQRGDEARLAEGKALRVEKARPRMIRRRARPLQPALAIEPRV